jgi:hypothetical protein
MMRGWRLELDAERCSSRVARHTVECWLTSIGCPDDEWFDTRLAVSELVRIAVGETVDPIMITASRDGACVRVAVQHRPMVTEPGTDQRDALDRLLEMSTVDVTSTIDGALHRSSLELAV